MRRALAVVCAAGAIQAVAVAATPALAAVPGALDGSYGRCGLLTAPQAAAGALPAGQLRLADGGSLAVGLRDGRAVTVRLNPDGQIDTAYGNGGVAVSAELAGFTEPMLELRTVAGQPDGKVLIAGRGGERNSGQRRATVARLNPDGSLDTSFGNGGTAVDVLPGGMRSDVKAVAVDATGRALVAGERDERFVVGRLTAAGALDGGWGTGGVVQLDFPGTTQGAAAAVRPLKNGTVLVGGTAGEQRFALARLHDNGALDGTFATGGVTLESPPGAARISAIEVLADGRIVVAGAGDTINGSEQAVGRFSPDGRRDPGFARDGFELTPDLGEASGLFVEPDGSLLVPGGGFARYSPAGALDPAFGAGGVFSSFFVGDIVLHPDGSAVGAVGHRTGTAFQRYALSGTALAALASQPAVCGLRIVTRRVRQLVRRQEDGRYGGLVVDFTSLEPGLTRWTATARSGDRVFTIARRRVRLEGAFPSDLVLPLTRRAQARLTRVRAVEVTVTARDSSGHTTTGERELIR